MKIQHEASAIFALLSGAQAQQEQGASALRGLIEDGKHGEILALRQCAEDSGKKASDADSWIRHQLSNCTRGKSFAHLPRLTVKVQKGLLAGLTRRFVEVKPDKVEKADEVVQQEQIAKALAILCGALEAGIQLNDVNQSTLNAILDMCDVEAEQAKAA